ncbi:ABC transporter permease [Actinomadura bangladeshensis]|uniref:ABC transporter permease n=1 Tax=Actinomadura bangladeshensis TaxID=453573 RepID=A0A4R4NVR0_9ACTN|nr:ABC transporter permease [Actinomadura bangladeshensis]TDC13595.1 ABC transporter permease [Actinomadura bangladeshensis]
MSTFESFKSLSRAMYLGFKRDRTALFFTILFPLMFLLIFGGVFGHQTTAKVNVVEVGKAPILEQAVTQGAEQLGKVMEVTRTSDRAAALRKVEKGDADAAVEQRGARLVVHYSAADQVKSGTVRGLMDSIVQAANQDATGRPPTYTMSAQQVEDDSLKAIQFFTPSLLGWALASAGVFGASQTLVSWRTKGILRRLQLSPAPIPTVFAARVAVSLAIALVQFALFVLVAQLPMFGLQLSGAWWMSIPMVIAGVLAFLSIGMLIGAWAKTQETAQAVTQLVVLPMAFLGGSFFPLDAAPGWMKTLSYIFPLRYLNEGMLNVMGRGLGPMSALPQIGVLLGVAAVGALIAVRLFRWEAA